nr:glycosyltransferase 87 family protein [Amycolatopsis sp. GM8]
MPRLSADPGRLLVALLIAGTLAFGVWGWLAGWHVGIDSAVYRSGALTFLHGNPLYSIQRLTDLPPWIALPFTYPPAAALLFVPLAALPAGLAWALISTASVISLAVVVYVCLRPARWLLIAGVTVAALALEPVWKTFSLGQVNLILLALIVVDVLLRPRWSGVLVGIAAAVKLTPLIFVAYLFVVGRWRDGLRALGTFVALQALMFALTPSDAVTYWTQAAFDPGRVGGVAWAFNQSFNGLLYRASHAASWSAEVALLVAAVLAVPAVWLVRRWHRRGEELAALLVTAFLGLLASPISWSHHWVWVVPLIALLIAKRRWVWAVLTAAFFASGVLMAVPRGENAELGWTVGQSIIGNAYVIAAVLGIVGLTVRELRLRYPD